MSTRRLKVGIVNVTTPPKQFAFTMNTIRSCFAAIVAFLVVAIDWSAADAVVCCNSSSVASGCGVAYYQNENQKFHTVEAIGGGTCDDNRTAVPVRKCCPPGRPYDPEVRFCGPAGADGDEYLRRMMQILRDGFRAVADAVLVGYDYEQPMCDATQVLVDVPAVEVRGMMEEDSSAIELPPGYCFDMTPTDELVARTCRPRDQYCGQDGYTCVNKCYKLDKIIVVDDDSRDWKQSEKPSKLSAYETDADGRTVGKSNSTVLPYHVDLLCSRVKLLHDGFELTTNGSLYRTDEDRLVPVTKYCLEYYAEAGPPMADSLLAFICAEDTESPAIRIPERKSNTWMRLVLATSFMPSVVCLALTLLVYSTLPYLRNVHGYYVMCYVACQFVSYSCDAIEAMTIDDINSPLCIPFGYFTLFTYLTSYCWLNVICFDIYWMLRYNNSINRNTSISVRTIMYHIYCWGFSSICVSTGYLFQHSQNETLLKLAPDIGYRSCWFFEYNGNGILIFFLIPSCVMLTVNLILFLLITIHFSRIKSELNKFQQTDNSKTEIFFVYKEKLEMSIKLFLLMGIPYLFRTLQIIFRIHWIIFDFFRIINRLHGVLIFIIFVAKRKVILDLRNKFRGSMNQSESTQINTVTEYS